MRTVADCEIVEIAEVAPGIIRMVLENEIIARDSKPGQFVNVRVLESLDPLLRRPFSVYAVYPNEGRFALLFDVVGRGTSLLARRGAGEKISVIGPLGTWFDLGDSADARHILVAGGCGAAPLHFLSDAICKRWGCEKATVLVGARSSEAVHCEREFRAHGVEVGISTDDGSYGYRGLVTDLLEQHLTSLSLDKAKNSDEVDRAGDVRIYSCGPFPMMQKVWNIAHRAGVRSCQVSLERAMACGVGICMGCVVKVRAFRGATNETRNEQSLATPEAGEWTYRRVCCEGPVFEAEELIWE